MAENLLNLNEVSLQRRALRENTALKVSKYGVFSGTYFPAFGLNTESKSRKIRTKKNSVLGKLFTQCSECGQILVSLRIQSECGKIRTRKNSVFGHFSRSVISSLHKIHRIQMYGNISKSRQLQIFYLI